MFPTKPALGRRMLACVLDASVPASWVAGDGGAPTSTALKPATTGHKPVNHEHNDLLLEY